MKVLITGGLGFTGRALTEHLIKKDLQVTVVSRALKPPPETPRQIRYVSADTTVRGAWQKEIEDQDGIINLAGASIFRRWTGKAKKRIYDSRILTTRNVVETVRKEAFLFSASAAGYYGPGGDREITEGDRAGPDFLARLCADWEREAMKAESRGARVVTGRIGVVLGRGGGALKQMVSPFKFFLGGPLGNGKQWFPWIHMEDLVRAVLFLCEQKDINGPVNFCAPYPVRNRELAKTMGKILKRPSFFPAPALMLRLALGDFGSMLLQGQKVQPEKLLARGFSFRYTGIEHALRDLLEKRIEN